MALDERTYNRPTEEFGLEIAHGVSVAAVAEFLVRHVIDVLRDDQSIIGGPKDFVALQQFGVNPVSGVFNLALSTVDTDVKCGSHNYVILLTLTSESNDSASIFSYFIDISVPDPNPWRGLFGT